MPPDTDPIDLALDELLELVLRKPGAAAEFEASRREFFRTPVHAILPRGAQSAEARLAARRHMEWFLLERPSDALQGVPVESVVQQVDELEPGEIDEAGLRALLSSTCGVFEVTSVTPGEGAWVKDLGALGEYPLHEPDGSHALAVGDVLVGRLFGIGDALHRLSPAAGFFRSEKLHRALADDLARAREHRRGVLRLSQAEIEAMFWPNVEEPAEDSIEVARSFLSESGVDESLVETILEELAAMPFDPTRVVPGIDDALAGALERLAFDTNIDLDQARRVLIDAWITLSSRADAARSNGAVPDTGSDADDDAATGFDAAELDETELDGEPSPTANRARSGRTPREGRSRSDADVRSAIEAFDRGRSAGRDLDVLFNELERELELDDDRDATSEDSASALSDEEEETDTTIDDAVRDSNETLAPDFPGVVGAMVEEFLWETRAPDADMLRLFAEYGANIGVFENLGARELLVFATIWLPERGALQSADDARRMLEVLHAFCEWSENVHDVPLLQAFRSVLHGVDASLGRIALANRVRAEERDLQRGEMFEVVAVGRGQADVRDGRGHVTHVQLDPRMADHLIAGDRLRATQPEPGSLAVHCCYPSEVARLEAQGRRAAGT